ncbi:hypothetical protein [Pseudenhygromyxa sp. WMMC2535]|nr:hypothetical protein [Pseudenhygromyxa sp. WMMC2535]
MPTIKAPHVLLLSLLSFACDDGQDPLDDEFEAASHSAYCLVY